MKKPCNVCQHIKADHAYSAQYLPGGQFKFTLTHPCQVENCKCADYQYDNS